MIHESTIDHSLNRLSEYFDSRVRIRPPATAAALADLERIVGTLPRDLTIFLSTCDGLRVALDGPPDELRLWHVDEMLTAIRNGTASTPRGNLVTVRGETCSERDCLVLESGPVHGTVIRCDPWTPGAELLNSTFGCYLDTWINFLMANYDSEGQPKSRSGRKMFDAAFSKAFDQELQPLSERKDVQAMLRQLDNAVSSGADFE